MKPLLVDTKVDRAGQNYHFWSYLSASLKEGHTITGRLYSNFLEGKDPVDLSADTLGLDVADKLILGLANKAPPACSLDDSTIGLPSEDAAREVDR